MRLTVILAVAALATCPVVACGQAMRVEYDVNVPAYSAARDADHEEFATSRGLAASIGWVSRRYIDGAQGHRWCVRIGRQAHKSEYRGNNPSVLSSAATTIEVGHDWYVARTGPVTWSTSAALGAVFVSKHNETYGDYCDSPFCNWPGGGLQVNVRGGLELPVSPGVAILAGVRGRLFGPGRTEMFPFAPGPVYSLGLELSGRQ